MSDCIFCKIAQGKIPARKVLEDDQCVAFHDLTPQAPVHVLVIPKQHLDGLKDAKDGDGPMLGHLLLAARNVAKELGLVEDGYRTVINTGAHGGQSVFHLHVHVLGGRAMAWPPG